VCVCVFVVWCVCVGVMCVCVWCVFVCVCGVFLLTEHAPLPSVILHAIFTYYT